MKIKHLINTGFSSQGDLAGSRLLNRDGSSNIRKKGLSFLGGFHLYHTLISMKITWFLLSTLVLYVTINLLFALAYLAVGIDNLVDSSVVNVESTFLRAFFFSSQTLTTLGYGQMSPTGIGANAIATLEAFIGLLLFALLTGLLYGRFSRPRAKLVYSDNALISPYKDLGVGLMVRFANPKNTSIIDTSAAMLFSYQDEENGERIRRYFNLDLELDNIRMLVTSWTLVHHINDNSPLKPLNMEFLRERNAEIIIQINGYDETYNQQVTSRASYLFTEDVIYGAKFDRAFVHTQSGTPILDFSKLSSYKEVSLD